MNGSFVAGTSASSPDALSHVHISVSMDIESLSREVRRSEKGAPMGEVKSTINFFVDESIYA